MWKIMKNIKNKKYIDTILEIILSVMVILFILLPFLSVFKESFIIDGRVDFKYYKNLFTNIKLLKNTLTLGFLTTILSIIASTVLAIFIYLSTDKKRKIYQTILAITLISPPFVTSLSYITLFGRRGFITHNLLGLSINPYNMWGVVFMQTLSFLSINTIILLGFLNSINKEVINSARSLGAGTNSIIKDILIPQSKNGIYTVLVLSFFKAASDFATPSIIGGRFNVLALESYFEVIANGNLSKASAMNVTLLIPILILFAIFRKSNKANTSSTDSYSKSEIAIDRKGILYNIIRIISVFLLLMLVSLYLSVILSAFTAMKKGSLTFTLSNFKNTRMFINDSMLRSIGYSLISAIFGTLIGFFIGYYVIIKNSRFMGILDMISNLPYLIPGTFFGLGYLLFFKAPPLVLTGTSAIVVLNILFKQLPFSSRVGNAAIKSVDGAIINSIRDLGGSTIDEMKDGILPNVKDSLAISLINSFTSSMTTVGSIIFLVYPGKKLMTLVMFDVINSGKYNEGSVIALLIMIICFIFNILISYILGEKNLLRGSENVLRN